MPNVSRQIFAKLSQTLAAIGIVGALSIGAAEATVAHYTATLVTPVDKTKEVTADTAIFLCKGSICTADNADSIKVCRALVKSVGPISAYGTPEKPFDADRLAQCNASP